MIIPIVNRFTCSKKQLPMFKQLINNKNMKPIIDYTNENYLNHKNNFLEIKYLCKHYSNETIAVKLSSLNVNNKTDVENYMDEIMNISINNNNTILIDAENYDIQDKINDITDKFMETYNKNNTNIFKTYQLYRNDYLGILENDLKKQRDYSIGFKLVRGAYYNQDKIHNILFNTIEETHVNYNEGIRLFIENFKLHDKLICATHNENSVKYALELIKQKNLTNIEFAQLMGMSDNMSSKLSNNYTVYKYLPYGDFKDTLPYLIRRLYENYPMIMNIFK